MTANKSLSRASQQLDDLTRSGALPADHRVDPMIEWAELHRPDLLAKLHAAAAVLDAAYWALYLAHTEVPGGI